MVRVGIVLPVRQHNIWRMSEQESRQAFHVRRGVA
jgi:hypothetical protein